MSLQIAVTTSRAQHGARHEGYAVAGTRLLRLKLLLIFFKTTKWLVQNRTVQNIFRAELEVFDKHSPDDDGTIQFIDSTMNQRPRNRIERKPAYTTLKPKPRRQSIKSELQIFKECISALEVAGKK